MSDYFEITLKISNFSYPGLVGVIPNNYCVQCARYRNVLVPILFLKDGVRKCIICDYPEQKEQE